MVYLNTYHTKITAIIERWDSELSSMAVMVYLNTYHTKITAIIERSESDSELSSSTVLLNTFFFQCDGQRGLE